jgi:ribosome modulation factor
MEFTEMPLLEQCWLQGFKASLNGVDESANPYPRHSKESHYWREGWWEQFFNEGDIRSAFK